MKIVMMTNTYKPHVGGVARSVEAFTRAFRARGCEVLVVAPSYENAEREYGVVRIRAIQKFNGSDFSVLLPIPIGLARMVEKFDPDIIHAHHPFLIGDTALRLATKLGVGLVFTHHTMYEQYTHYAPGDSEAMKRFIIRLSTGYANLADAAIAPSESIAEALRERGVKTPIEAIPTGVDVGEFKRGSGPGMKAALGIPRGAPTIGHVGRLAPEKNLDFLARAVASAMKREPKAHFLLVGGGPSMRAIQERFEEEGLLDRLRAVGPLSGRLLVSAFRAIDAFAFASKTETQGMVMVEAMAAGAPVVALDAPGARETVRDGENGRLLAREDDKEFAEALIWTLKRGDRERKAMKRAMAATAERMSLDRSADRVLKLYERVIESEKAERKIDESAWSVAMEKIQTEWDLIRNMAEAAGAALGG